MGKKKVDIKVVMHPSHLGATADSDPLDIFLRALSMKHSKTGEWADKYGTDYEDAVVMIHQFCWCEDSTCLWCNGNNPNFHHKPSGFKVWWYKYIGRGMRCSGEAPKEMFALITQEDVEAVLDSSKKSNQQFRDMFMALTEGTRE